MPLPGGLPPPPPPPAAMIAAHQQAAAQKAVASKCSRLGPGGAPVVLAPDGTAPATAQAQAQGHSTPLSRMSA